VKKTKNQIAWETMRKKKEFAGSDVMSSRKDATIAGYLNALERAGYLVQTSPAKSQYDREYKLVLDTGEKCPVYQTSRRRGDNLYPAMVKDRNISRDVFLEGRNVEVKSKKEAEFLDFIEKNKSFTYHQALQLFSSDKIKGGYNYTLFHYYLEKFKKEKIIEEVEKHKYSYIQ